MAEMMLAELLRRGRECAASLTGDPDDATEIDSPEKAWAAIDEALAMGKQRCNELNELNISLVSLAEDRVEAENLVRDVFSNKPEGCGNPHAWVASITALLARVRAEQREVSAAHGFEAIRKILESEHDNYSTLQIAAMVSALIRRGVE